MTERLYYENSYLWQFDAAVTSVKNGKRPGEWEVTLDRSAFYPTSGGQPFDTGTISFGKIKAKVTNVEVGPEGEVIHTVDREIPAGTAVHGEIDGVRRTDHMEQHGGQVPSTREALEALPGVGRKTANVILNVAFGEPTMAVDTHVYRVSCRTGLAPGKTPLAVEQRLLARVPEKYLQHAHHWLILHGLYICQARQPRCWQCPVADCCDYKEKTPDPAHTT